MPKRMKDLLGYFSSVITPILLGRARGRGGFLTSGAAANLGSGATYDAVCNFKTALAKLRSTARGYTK